MSWLERSWYSRRAWTVLLRPLSGLYCLAVLLRRGAYRVRLLRTRRLPVPVVVVGNLTVGGTGKTPLVAWLAGFLREAGYRPGIVSRGYGGKAKHWPQQVRPDGDPVMVGDEAILLARRTGCPMAVGPDRVAASRSLLEHAECDVIISDDGLQHYALGRDIEIAVVDGVRRFGNGLCLPAGPLRERKTRLNKVDLVISNGSVVGGEFGMQFVSGPVRAVHDEAERPLQSFRDQPVHAVAGIGNPDRFFSYLHGNGLRIIEHPFADHHLFRAADLDFGDDYPIIMTEKDAVKCRRLALGGLWYLPIQAEPQERFGQRLLALLETKRNG